MIRAPRAVGLIIAALIFVELGVFLVGGLSLKAGASPNATSVKGLIGADTTWTTGDSPVIVTSSVLVQQGVTLTIEPGVTVKFDPGLSLQVSGELIARGSGDAPIVFTSNRASPASGDWGYILFTDTGVDAVYDSTGDYVSGSILEYCVIEYAGAVEDQYTLWIDRSSPFINHCTIMDNASTGIRALFSGPLKIMNNTVVRNAFQAGIAVSNSGAATVSGNTVTGNSAMGIRISFGNASLSGNTIMGNDGRGILIDNGTVTVSGNTIIGNTTSAPASDGGGIYISGSATLIGNIISENAASNRGGGIYLNGGTVTLSGNTITRNRSSGAGGGTFIAQSTATLSGNTIAGNRASVGGGIYITSAFATVTVSGNTLAGNTASGDGSSIFIACCIVAVTLSGNTIIGNISPTSTVRWGSSGPAFNNNLFGNDAPYLVHNALTNNYPDANMENNWWGTTDSGDIAVSIYDWFDDSNKGFVDYTSFLTQPNTGAPVSPPLGLVATGDGNTLTIDLRWNANPESDIVAYKVYYDTGDSGFPYPGKGAASGDSPVDVGNATSATLSGLAPFVTHYIAVTAYDSDGNESWFSAEVAVVLQPGVDTTPPYTSGHDPAKGATGVPVDTNIVVHVRDDFAGVDQSSIVLTVDGVDVTGEAVITGGTGDYTVSYDPPADFDYGQLVNVTVDAGDIAGNVMPTESYSFTTVGTGAIQGNVFLQGNANHAGITVVADGVSTTTTVDGAYIISGLPPGSYTITAGMKGFLSAEKVNVVVVGAQTTNLADATLRAGDLDSNGVIDINDLTMLASNLSQTESPWP